MKLKHIKRCEVMNFSIMNMNNKLKLKYKHVILGKYSVTACAYMYYKFKNITYRTLYGI